MHQHEIGRAALTSDDLYRQALNQAPKQAYLGQLSVVQPPVRKVFVILPDYGSEGLRDPIAAFRTKVRADQAMALLAHGHASFRVVEVELQDA